MGRRKNSAPAAGVVAAAAGANVATNTVVTELSAAVEAAKATLQAAKDAGDEEAITAATVALQEAEANLQKAATVTAVDAVAAGQPKTKKADTVRMVRDEPAHPGGPTAADVHPDEVEGWALHGWRAE